MSEFAGTETPIAPESGFEPAAEEQPFTVPQDEWNYVVDTLGQFGQMVEQQQQYEWQDNQAVEQAVLEELMDPYSENYNPQTAIQVLAEAAAAQVAPALEWIQEQNDSAALDDAQDFANQVLIDAGIEDSDEALDEVFQVAEETVWPQLGDQYWRQYQPLYEEVLATHGPEAAAQWIAQSGHQIAVAALQQAAAAVKYENEKPDYAQGGTALDRVMGNFGRSGERTTQHDYRQGGTAAGQIFGNQS
jgi:hypothetical protein